MNGCITYLLLLVLILNYVKSQEFVGDSCTIPSNGKNGECQLLTDCLAALQLLQSYGIYPEKTCGFSGKEPIVCCEDITFFTTRKTPAGATTSTLSGPLDVGSKSKDKCKEYGQYVFSTVQRRQRVDQCSIGTVDNISATHTAKAKEFPHMALVGYDDYGEKIWQCSGSLISDKYVLTAGYCLHVQQYGDAQYVRLGELVLGTTTDDAKTQDFNILRKIKYPDYDPPSHYNDIALLELDGRAKLDHYVRPACLNTDSDIDNEYSIASGWCRQADDSKTLMKINLENFSHRDCNSSHRTHFHVRLRSGILDDIQLCAGFRNWLTYPCIRLIGEPLQIVNTEEVYCTYKIIGVASFGKAYGIVGDPGIYTRVSAYIKWIEDIIWA